MVGAVALTSHAMAAPTRDPLIEGARQCTQNFPVQEQAQGIPTHLLAAISSTESGRWHSGLGMAVPWPWTINVEGKGYYFATKAEAVAQTAEYLRKGYRSIDVGCMQVNLKHHPKAFSSIEEAFDPATNVAYAATFLRTNYNDLGDWIKATAAYHSRTDFYGRQYLVRIEKSWNSIVSKVAQARANQGLAPVEVAHPKFDTASAVPAKGSAARAMNRIDSTRNVKVIQVSQASRRGSEVMVVKRGPLTPAPIKVADASAATAAGEMMVKDSAAIVPKSIGVDSRGQATNSNAASAPGPKFVFAN
jgi:hypothetical protein